MSLSFMTVLIFLSIILLVLYSLCEYSSMPSSYSQLYVVKNYKEKIEEQDGIIIFAYIVILFGIIFPNLNQVD